MLAGAVPTALLLTGFLILVFPGCSDITTQNGSILCMGGLGEPAWKRPVVFFSLLLGSGTLFWRRTES